MTFLGSPWPMGAAIGTLLLGSILAETWGVPGFLLWMGGVAWVLWVLQMLLQLAFGQEGLNHALHLRITRSGGIRLAILILGIAALLGWRGPPGENLLGIQDESYNLSTALALIRHGKPTTRLDHLSEAIADNPEWVQMRPVQAQRAIGPDTIGPEHPSLAYLFLEGGDPGKARSIFPLAYPMVAAGLGKVNGVYGIYWSNSLMLLALGCSGGLLMLRAGFRWISLGAWALIMSQPLHLWLSKSGFAELLLAMLTLQVILIAKDACGETSDSVRLSRAAFLGGLLPMIKVEGLLVSACVLAGCLVIARTKDSLALRVLPAWGLGSAAAAAVLYLGGSAYSLDTLQSLPLANHGWSLTVAAALTLLLLRWIAKSNRGAQGQLTRWKHFGIAWASVGLLTLGALVWLLWIRPATGGSDQFYYWPYRRFIPSLREFTLPRLTWYFSTAGLLIGVAGVWLMPMMKPRRDAWLWFALIAIGSLFLLGWDIRNNPLQPYAMRRLVSFTTPGLCIGIAACAGLFARGHPCLKRLRQWTAGAAMITMTGAFLAMGSSWNVKGDHHGIHHALETIADHLPKHSQVYLNLKGPAHQLFLPLALGHGCRVIPLPGSSPNHPEAMDLLSKDAPARLAKGIFLYLISQDITLYANSNPQISSESVKNILIEDLRLIHQTKHKPKRTFLRSIPVHIARLDFAANLPAPADSSFSKPSRVWTPTPPPPPKRHEMQRPDR